MSQTSQLPIQFNEWGKYIVNGQEHSDFLQSKIGAGKNIRIIGTDVTEWVIPKGHDRKLSIDFITGVFGIGIDVLIVGTGHKGMLEYQKRLPGQIKAKGIAEALFLQTTEACAEYNRRFQNGERVALLAHGTC